jgi:hypothetical protein
MYRMIVYRGFEIHVQLTSSADELYQVSLQIKGGAQLAIPGDRSGRIPLRNGPFTRRWAYLIAETAGQAAIDLLLEMAAGDQPSV